MKPAVLEFQRNRVKRQPPDAASTDILNTIMELRSNLRSVKKAITAVERLAIAQYGEKALKPRKSVPAKRRIGSDKPKIQLVRFPYPAPETDEARKIDYAAQNELGSF
jgi:sensor domain CHASE-containing protein